VTQPQPRKSDLKVRVLSALVMLALAGLALWRGGAVWLVFVAAIAVGVIWEWWGLVRRFVPGVAGRVVWMIVALLYVVPAAITLGIFRLVPPEGWVFLMAVLLGVIGTDVGAYFSGRTFGGPKIAPAISPSKTWSGLAGGILGATAGIALALRIAVSDTFSQMLLNANALPFADGTASPRFAGLVMGGVCIAVIAQSGDFFESWMKRRAGVKDSGHLIPGHGGLFDRTDGLLAVSFVLALLGGQGFLFPAT